jgi:hypothetical protein
MTLRYIQDVKKDTIFILLRKKKKWAEGQFFLSRLVFFAKGFSLRKFPLLMNGNSVFMPKKQQGGKILKK